MNTTRKGKIARLPQDIRETLNRRLADGAPGKTLVKWLNTLDDVRTVLDREFDGRPILEQNLSEWKLGGFKDWESNQQTLDFVRSITQRAEEVKGASNTALTDALSSLCAVRVARRLVALIAKGDDDSLETQAELLELTSLVYSLRRGDHTAERLRIEREWLELDVEKLRELTEADHLDWAQRHLDELCKCYKKKPSMSDLRFALFGNQGNPTIPDLPPHHQNGVPSPQVGVSGPVSEDEKVKDDAHRETVGSAESHPQSPKEKEDQGSFVDDPEHAAPVEATVQPYGPQKLEKACPNPARSKQIKPIKHQVRPKPTAKRLVSGRSRVAAKGKGYSLSSEATLMR